MDGVDASPSLWAELMEQSISLGEESHINQMDDGQR